MRRSLRLPILIVTLSLGMAIGVMGRGYARGTTAAIVDQLHGRSRLYLLGCGYYPRTPYEERRDELLAKNYQLGFEAIGGIAPSDLAVQFQRANNLLTWNILRMRFGRDFLGRVERQARREVLDVGKRGG